MASRHFHAEALSPGPHGAHGGLAPNLFYGTGLAACVLVLRQSKSAKRKNKVLIADASTLFSKGRAQNFLEPGHAEEILDWVRGFAELDAQHLASGPALRDAGQGRAVALRLPAMAPRRGPGDHRLARQDP